MSDINSTSKVGNAITNVGSAITNVGNESEILGNAATKLGLTVGELAVKHSLITITDLEKAVKTCANLENSDDAIPEYLVAQNLISQKDCDKLFAMAMAMLARSKDILFGNLAIKKGFITESILELALDEQTSLFKNKKKYTLLGNILVDAGMLTPQQRDTILLEQNRNYSGSDIISSIDSTSSSIDRASSSIDRASYNNDSSRQNRDGEVNSTLITSNTKTFSANTSQTNAQKSVSDSSGKSFAQSEVFPCGIRLIIQGDGNAAYLFKTAGFDKEMSIGQIKELLASRDIIHGIVENSLIQKFIDSDKFLTKAFKIAQGNAPIQGQNASIRYFFTKKHLKAGSIREDGTMDFRERGDIPQVEKGAVLAIKRNALEGKVGKNIFNDTIRVLPTRDIRLRLGKGTALSPDKLKVIATVSGQPKLDTDGTIHVYETFVVTGDVDFKTGNIYYQGDVTVRGCIQNGFIVKGNNIRAEEVDGATIIAQGNVVVIQGINESKISSQGSVSAKFIQKSIISSVGDVTSKKEVVDSTIDCSGACHVKGIIVYSRIAAKMGLYAKQVGMEKAPASTIRVGSDIFALKAMENIKQEIIEKKELEKNFQITINTMQQAIDTAEIEILRMIRIKERGQKELNIMLMKKNIAEAEQQMEQNSEQIEALLQEQDNLTEWMERNPGVPIIKVEGQIMVGTNVYGRYSEDTIKESVKAVIIREDYVSRSIRDNETGSWKMYITKI